MQITSFKSSMFREYKFSLQIRCSSTQWTALCWNSLLIYHLKSWTSVKQNSRTLPKQKTAFYHPSKVSFLSNELDADQQHECNASHVHPTGFWPKKKNSVITIQPAWYQWWEVRWGCLTVKARLWQERMRESLRGVLTYTATPRWADEINLTGGDQEWLFSRLASLVCLLILRQTGWWHGTNKTGCSLIQLYLKHGSLFKQAQLPSINQTTYFQTTINKKTNRFIFG